MSSPQYPEGQNLPEIALSLMVFEVNNIFNFRKYSRRQLKLGKFKIFDRP